MARRLMLALVVALVISGLFTFWLSRRVAHASRVVVVPPNQYVAAARALDPGEVIRREDVNLINWPKDHPLDGSFMKVDDVVGRAVLYPLSAGQPILDRQLAAAGAGIGLTGRIPTGYARHRAALQRSGRRRRFPDARHPCRRHRHLYRSGPSAAAYRDRAPGCRGAGGRPSGSARSSGKPVSVDVVTLLLAPEDAEKATLASEKGTIHFVLRNGGDHKQSAAPPVNLAALAELPAKPQPGIPVRRSRADRPAPKPWVVETMMGDKRSTASFY